eukprot:Gregarina_sp_Poly_1__7290@NODE_3_length_27868_cov_154_961188_g2_i0_p5_GENE_NODE_3_length_27868_cov_154_961188_g2_i0NODE_3_length_27868_cov_154_961188_g2_i0_p5_ORF_typecomplete_len738_score86_82Mak10/PF04112_13/0_35Mak10/PF04112_13/1_3e03Fbox/PF00646_33/0_24_NODE_3_length_27868_cov_154_961188_g2_i01670118914
MEHDFRKSLLFLEQAKSASVSAIDLIEALLDIKVPLLVSDPLICLWYHFSERAEQQDRQAINAKPHISLYLPSPGSSVDIDKATIEQHIGFIENLTGLSFPFDVYFMGRTSKFKIFNTRRLLQNLRLPPLDAKPLPLSRKAEYAAVSNQLLSMIKKCHLVSDLFTVCRDALQHDLVDLETSLVMFAVGYLRGIDTLCSVVYNAIYVDDLLSPEPLSVDHYFSSALHKHAELSRFVLRGTTDLESWIQHIECFGDALNITSDLGAIWSINPWVCKSDVAPHFQLSRREARLWIFVADRFGGGTSLDYMNGVFDLVDPVKLSMKLFRVPTLLQCEYMDAIQASIIFNLEWCRDLIDLVRYLRATCLISRTTKLRIFAAYAFFGKAFATAMVSQGLKHRFTVRVNLRKKGGSFLGQDLLVTILKRVVVYMDLPSRWKCSCLCRELREFCCSFKIPDTASILMGFSSGYLHPDPFHGLLSPVIVLTYRQVGDFKNWLHFSAWFITTALEIYRRREDPFALNPKCQPRNNICCKLHYEAVRLQFAGFRAFWRVGPLNPTTSPYEVHTKNLGEAPRHSEYLNSSATLEFPLARDKSIVRSLMKNVTNARRPPTASDEYALEDIVMERASSFAAVPIVSKARVTYARNFHSSVLETHSPAAIYLPSAKLDSIRLQHSVLENLTEDMKQQLFTELVAMVTQFVELVKSFHRLRADRGCFFQNNKSSFRLEGSHLALHIHFPQFHP